VDFEPYYQRYVDYLEKRRLFNSQQRKAIAVLVYEFRAPFTAEDLIQRSRELEENKLTRPTVYRLLNELLNANLVSTSEGDNGRVYRRNEIGSDRGTA
jgi:Fe2+ or Zn2+ uptake regulation protein